MRRRFMASAMRSVVLLAVATGPFAHAADPKPLPVSLGGPKALAVSPTSLFASPSGLPAVYVGENFTIEVTALGGSGSYSYEWLLDGESVIGAPDNSQYAVTGADLDDAGLYSCRVNDGVEPPVTSDPLAIAVYAAPQISQHPMPENKNVCDTAIFSIAATGGWGTLTYQWYKDADYDGIEPGEEVVDNERIFGALTSTLEIQLLRLADGANYACTVTDSGPGPSGPKNDTSNLAALNLTNDLKIGAAGQPQDQIVYVGDTVSLHVVVCGGSPEEGIYQYQWFVDADNDRVKDSGEELANGGRISGADTDTLTIVPAATGDSSPLYRAWAWDAWPTHPWDVSDAAKVEVHAPLSVTSGPDNLTVYAGENAQFTVAVSNAIPPITYAWERNTGGGFNPLPGKISPTLTVGPVSMPESGYQYRCIVSAGASDDPASSVPTQQTSATAKLTVAPTIYVTGPTDARAYIDAPADPAFNLSGSATGGLNPHTYAWKRRTGGGAFEVLQSGAYSGGSVVLAVNPSQQSAAVYEYVFDITDDIRTTSSAPAVVEFDTHLSFTHQPSDVTVQAGEQARFEVVIGGGLGALDIQWQKEDGSKGWTPVGLNDPVFTIDDVQESDAGYYRVVVSDAGSTITSTADSIESEVVRLRIGAAVSVSGMIGLAILTAMSAVGGAGAIRRKR